MNNQPDEGTLIAHLYGDLEPKEKEAVQQYLNAHPEAMAQYQALADTLGVMRHLGDKEVIAPPLLMDQQPAAVPFIRSPYMKTIMGIAASLLLILFAGKILGPEITYSQGELRISFGENRKVKEVSDQPMLTAREVQDMINASLVKTTETIDAHFTERQEKVNESIRQSLAQNSSKVDNLIKNSAQTSQEQLRTYVAGLQTENQKIIKDYLTLSAKEQNDYVENMLVGFSKYVKEQRAQDLLTVQTRLGNLEKNNDQFKQDTEQVIASIISNTPIKKTSY